MACEHKNLQWVENVYRYNTVVWHVCLDCDAILYSRTKHKGLKGPQPNKRLQNCLVKKHERLDKLRE